MLRCRSKVGPRLRSHHGTPFYEKAADGRCSKHCRPSGHGAILQATLRIRGNVNVRSGRWEFAGPDDAKAEIRAAVRYLLKGAIVGARGDIVQEINAIVRQVASGLPPEPPNSLDDGLRGG